MANDITWKSLRTAEELNCKLKDYVGKDQLLEMAKGGVIPHYRISIPGSDVEHICFMKTEIDEWFTYNCVRFNEGKLLGRNTFLSFDSSVLVTEKDTIPPELKLIGFLYKVPTALIENLSGVYFLCFENKIVYIGQASQLSIRLGTHAREGLKKFDSAYFIPCLPQELNKLETDLIHKYLPKYNIACVSKLAKQERESIQTDNSVNIPCNN